MHHIAHGGRTALLVILGAFVVLIAFAFLVSHNFSVSWGNNEANADEHDNQTAQAGNGATNQTATCEERPLPASQDVIEVEAGCNIKGDVFAGSSRDNLVKLFDDDAKTGLIVSCPNGCFVKAPFGANVTPRDTKSLQDEMAISGCEGGCNAPVPVVPIDRPGNDKQDGTTPPAVDSGDCGLELQASEKRVIPKGCIIVGDVFARIPGKGDFVWTTDKRQDTGAVHQLEQDLEVLAPFGAGVHDASLGLENLRETTKLLGCHLDKGCTGGVFDWVKKP